MFINPNFQQYRNNEFLQFCRSVSNYCEEADPELLNIKEPYDKFVEGTEKLGTAFGIKRGSVLTGKLVAKNAERKRLIKGIKQIANGNKNHFITEYVEAAKRLHNRIIQFGDVARKNYPSVSTILDSIVELSEDENELKADVSLLGLSDWIMALKASNTEFRNLNFLRTEENAAKPRLNMKELRKESVAQFRALAAHINSYALINSSELHLDLINRINVLTKRYNHIRRKHKRKTTEEHLDISEKNE